MKILFGLIIPFLISHSPCNNIHRTRVDGESILNTQDVNNVRKGDYESGQYYFISPNETSVVIPNSFYFERLYDYHGHNESGICAIIALQIILGYYDTFCNDSIVNDTFDVETKTYTSVYSVDEFEQSPGAGQMYEDERFRDYLLNLAFTVNGVTPVNNGMTNNQQIALLQSYLNGTGLSYSLNYCEGNIIQDISGYAKTVIRNAIDQGRPVIANSISHSMVAYGYDDTFVYVHTGYGYVSATPWSTFEAGLFEFASIGAIDINFSCSHFHSNNYYSYFTNDYYCPCGYTSEKTTYYPDTFEFEQQYFYYRRRKEITISNYTIETYRLRTGFIEYEFINLSPRREDAGLAYLEVISEEELLSIVINVSFWGPNEHYNLNNSDHYVEIQYMNSIGDWETIFDLLHDINLSTNRYNQNQVAIYFPSGVTAFRIIASNDDVGNRNSGRISIGELSINHE